MVRNHLVGGRSIHIEMVNLGKEPLTTSKGTSSHPKHIENTVRRMIKIEDVRKAINGGEVVDVGPR